MSPHPCHAKVPWPILCGQPRVSLGPGILHPVRRRYWSQSRLGINLRLCESSTGYPFRKLQLEPAKKCWEIKEKVIKVADEIWQFGCRVLGVGDSAPGCSATTANWITLTQENTHRTCSHVNVLCWLCITSSAAASSLFPAEVPLPLFKLVSFLTLFLTHAHYLWHGEGYTSLGISWFWDL